VEQSRKVTVLFPAYNAAPYLREAIDSVLSQTYSDFEFLIINDGSKDNSAEIIDNYTDPRIRVVHQENMGLVRTLNKGLGLAEGELIARFDADDVCYPARLDKQVRFMMSHPDYVLVGSEANYMDEEGNFIFRYLFKEYEDSEIRQSGFKNCPFIHSSVMFRKQAVLDAGGYDERAITFEDHLLWRKLADVGKMKNVKEPLIKVRFNPASVTIDEKWRGKEFQELKQRSIANEQVSNTDYELLKHILHTQNFKEYKEASYYSMMGKKFLWDQHKPAKAREFLAKAIAVMPGKAEPYMLYVLSYFPEKIISALYNRVKKNS